MRHSAPARNRRGRAHEIGTTGGTRDRTTRPPPGTVSGRRGDDRRIAPGDPVGTDDLRRRRPALPRARARLQRRRERARDGRTARPSPKRPAPCARSSRCAFPRRPSRPPPSCPISTATRGRRSSTAAWKPTASDPGVQQQFGMIAGMPDAGQLNALATLNIRGERSVTCRGDFDRHPSEGPLPPGAPPVCENFRRQPDALEQAAELDATYGRNPDLEKMPMYGVVFSFKDPFDTKDMRTTGRRRRPLRHRFSRARSRAGRAAPQEGRDHLRQGRQHGIQRPRGRSGRTQQARQGAAVGARLPAQHVGRQSLESLRHDARGLARLQLGLGGVGQRQPGDGEPGRGNARLLPRPGQPQRGGADTAAQGACSASTAARSARTSIATAAASCAARSPIARKFSTR